MAFKPSAGVDSSHLQCDIIAFRCIFAHAITFDNSPSRETEPMDFTCKDCDKVVHVSDSYKVKTMRCPSCRVVMIEVPESDNQAYELEDRPTRTPKGRNLSEEDDDPDDGIPIRKRTKSRNAPQAPTPLAPIIWAIVAILMPFPIVGFASGSIAMIAQIVALVACTISLVLMFWLLATDRNRP
jgi:hypothetical protein